MSERLFLGTDRLDFSLDHESLRAWSTSLDGLSVSEMAAWETDNLPVGRLCLPSLRWALRRSTLPDDETTRRLFRQYLLSSISLAARVEDVVDRIRPQTLVVFNGITFPEAIARHVAGRKGVRVVTHEVGVRPLSAFFSHSDATFRDVQIPEGFQLSQAQDGRLDSYLKARSQGQFSMAGVRFWPVMTSVPEAIRVRMSAFRQVVVVFTNVIFDTSQVHANSLFADMFEWLEYVLKAAGDYPDTLFVLRAHPDEDRPGKESQESVAQWAERSAVRDLANILFIGPADSTSSYELIRLAKLVLVYSSSIGLEASIAGATVLSAGRARYTHVQAGYFPSDKNTYLNLLREFLQAETLAPPASFRENARRYLYFELFHASLDFSRFLEPYPGSHGFVTLRRFDPRTALDAQVEELEILRQGILEGRSFEYPAE